RSSMTSREPMAQEIVRRPGLLEERVAERRIPPARLDGAQIAASPEARQAVVIPQGHRLPEADEPERLERPDEDLAARIPDELRGAEGVLAAADELEEREGRGHTPREVLGTVAARLRHRWQVLGGDGRYHGDVIDVGRLESKREVLLHDVVMDLVLDLLAAG